MAATSQQNIHIPSWLQPSLYPFTSRSLQLQAGTMHYIDEGEGEVILFIHGTPTWSFLYRNQVRKLSENYRCIALDHIGFGLSDKPENFSGTPQAHTHNLEQFIDALQLDNITLVVHDFGGPIGLAYAIMHPEKIKRIVVMNTWLWQIHDKKAVQKVDKFLRSSIGKFLYLTVNFSTKFLLKQGFYNKKILTKNIHAHYIQAFPNKSSRYAPWRIGKALLGSSGWYQQQWEQREVITHKPFLVLWGIKDTFITSEYLQTWKNTLRHARIIEYECGHFVQEEKAEEVTKEITAFMHTV